jgi:hypothetical protein
MRNLGIVALRPGVRVVRPMTSGQRQSVAGVAETRILTVAKKSYRPLFRRKVRARIDPQHFLLS